MFSYSDRESPFSSLCHAITRPSFLAFVIVIILLTCVAITLSGCGFIVKRQIRKIKRKCDVSVQVIAFVSDGCAPCQEAKIKLSNAGVRVNYITVDCYNRGIARAWKVTSVPTFFVVNAPGGNVRTQDIGEVLRLCRRRPCDGCDGC